MVTLTGVYPDLGREIRDGAMLAVQMINESGGINGKSADLIIKDNKFNIDVAKLNYEELIRENVVAIIGPATSTMAKNLLQTINHRKILVISPTASSSELSGLDDYLIRLRQSNKEDAEVLAKYVIERFKIKKIGIIYDVSNPVYCIDFLNNFKLHFSKDISFYVYPFGEQTNVKDLVKNVLNKSPDAILLISEVYTTSLLIQNLRKLDSKILILIAPWAKFSKLLEYGGKRINGVITVDSFDEDYSGDYYKMFKNKFIERFGREPSVASTNSFDSVIIVKQAIEKGASQKNIKEVIISIGKFEGLQGQIIINRFGDREIKPFVFRVENGKFRRVEW